MNLKTLFRDVFRNFYSLPARSNLNNRQSIIEGNELLRRAEKCIRIVTGDLSREFYEDSNTINNIQKAVARGVTVEIIEYSSEEKRGANTKPILNIPGVRYWKTNRSGMRHMLLIDDNHLRIERTHEEPTVTPALIVRNARLLASEYNKIFEALIKEAEEQG